MARLIESMSPLRIHPTAIVDRSSELGPDVTVGAYAVIGAHVRIGARTRIDAHAIVDGPTVLGEDNVVFPFAVIGTEAQHKKPQKSGICRLIAGARNIFREHVTVHRGTDGRETIIGDDNLFMVGSHIAHDVNIGSFCAIANGVQLAGHVTVEDHVTFGGVAAVAQHARIGEGAFIAGGAMVERDVPPFVIAQGDRARVRALNKVGLRRRGVSDLSIANLEVAFRLVFVRKNGSRADIVAALDRSDPFVDRFARAL